MRAQIKVTDLTVRQWEWLQGNLMLEYDISENDVRVCVQFELVPEVGPAHREMSVRDFVALMSRLKGVHREDDRITGGYLPDQCKCGFRAPELGPHPMCPVHREDWFDDSRMSGMTAQEQRDFENRTDFPGWDAL